MSNNATVVSDRTIITFLGTRPQPATYLFNGNTYSGEQFAKALHQFCPHTRMLVCVTEQARASSWPLIEALNDPRIALVEVPTVSNPAEMWKLFEIITAQVAEDEHVVFDITHAFRSIPFLVFLFAAYLKAAKRVTIDAIYYGALELGNPAPVHDLSEFVAMIDWITATDQFVQSGSGEALANLLRDRVPPGPVMRTDLQQRDLGNGLKNLAGVIEDTSASLAITHPLETMAQAANMERALDQAQSATAALAKPFVVLAEQVRQAYAPFALGDAKNPSKSIENLRIQHGMIEWYIDKGQYVQAATLMREWLVSLGMVGIGISDLFNRGFRDEIENSLNNLAELRKPNPRKPKTPNRDGDMAVIPHQSKLVDLWIAVTVLRNDLAHCGMDPKSTKNAKAVANSISGLRAGLAEVCIFFLTRKS